MTELHAFCHEEDLFPELFARREERPWGLLYLDEGNPDSFDSNHALLRRCDDAALRSALREIADYYRERGRRPVTYQSALDDGWFGEIAPLMAECGWDCWQETQRIMVLREESRIVPGADVAVERLAQWPDALAQEVFHVAGEPWEIPVARKTLASEGGVVLAARLQGRFAGVAYGHAAHGVIRLDYMLTATDCRGRGVGSAMAHAFAAWARAEGLPCYLWPDGDGPARIYQAAGFRDAAVLQAGRACLKDESH